MNRALRAAASGMFAQQTNIDTIANNLANLNTTGFKRTRPEFQDLMYQTIRSSGVTQNPNIQPPLEMQVGTGSTTVATLRNFTQGDVTPTGNPLDLAIQGDGFFQVRRPDGTLAYTRDGALKMSSDGTLVTSQGYMIEPGFTLGDTVAEVTIGKDGTIEVASSGEREPAVAGQIELARFINPAGLRAIGNGLYVETVASGIPLLGTAGSAGYGEILQSNLESSNVDVVEEMINMITAQRAYEINAKSIKSVEDMLAIANNLKRS
jgi:flagellar basal-body rod protein FlgG